MKPHSSLAPLTPLYRAAVMAKNFAYDHGLRRQHALQTPVVSIGNLSTGGSGKTPFVIALARLLTESGIPVDVLSRGYGRSSDAVVRVDPASHSTADQYGDEPLLIARNAAVPVYVGRSRHAAGLLAEQTSPRIHILDDGFQHRQIKRSLDVVLVHGSDLDQNLLPAGHLREPLSSLRRAHVVVLREQESALAERLRPWLAPEASLWHVRRRMVIELATGAVVAFCGIAHPEEFFLGLIDNRLSLAATLAFPDHHTWTSTDLTRLCTQAKLTGATRFITTEKDYTRLPPAAVALLETCAPVEVARLETAIVEADAAVNRIRTL